MKKRMKMMPMEAIMMMMVMVVVVAGCHDKHAGDVDDADNDDDVFYR